MTFNNLSFLFFVPLIFVGSFFLLNLTLAVIKSNYSEEEKLKKKARKQREQQKLVEKKANSKNKNEEDIAKDEKERLKKARKDYRMQIFFQSRKLLKIKSKMMEILDRIREKKEASLAESIKSGKPMNSDFRNEKLPYLQLGKQQFMNRSIDKTISEKEEEYLYSDVNVS